jgi:hypothetical protein
MINHTAPSPADTPVPLIDSLDLSRDGVLKHFAASGRRGQLLTFLMALDGFDKWAVDFEAQSPPQDVQLYLRDLSQFIATVAVILHRVPREFAEVLAYLTTTRCMYVIRYVSQHNTQFLDQLAFLIGSGADSDPNLATIRRRFETFSRARLLGEIFSGKRLSRIVSIMRSDSNE